MSGYVQPGRSDVHVDRPLTNMSIAFLQSQDAFVAARAFPNIPVSKQSDKYFTFPRGAFNRDEMELRAPATESAGANYTISTDSYSAEVWALHRLIPDQVRDNTDDPLSPDRESVEFLTYKGLIRREREWASTFFVTGVWTTEVTGVAGVPGAGQFQRWDEAASTPIEDVRRAKRVVQALTGFRPNKMIMSRPVYDALLDHPDIVGRLDRGQTSGPAMTLRQNLAALFEVEEVMVMDAIFNSAAEGATDSHGFIAGDHALLCYAPASPGLMTPSAGYTFSWRLSGAAGVEGNQIRRFRKDDLDSDKIEIQMAFDMKVVAADLGYFFLGAVS
jgi:hypothetical protein